MATTKYYNVYETAIGSFTIGTDEDAITILQTGNTPIPDALKQETPLTCQAVAQLAEYLSGCRQTFDLPLNPQGTPFQKKVWAALCQIPYGVTKTYGDIAKMVGNPKACRAVGMANNRNPIMILIPCHRVIGANGSLTGYGGGLPLKEHLLKLENAMIDPPKKTKK